MYGLLRGYSQMYLNPASVGISIHLLHYAGFLGWFHTAKKVFECYIGPGQALLEQIKIENVLVFCCCLFLVLVFVFLLCMQLSLSLINSKFCGRACGTCGVQGITSGRDFSLFGCFYGRAVEPDGRSVSVLVIVGRDCLKGSIFGSGPSFVKGSFVGEIRDSNIFNDRRRMLGFIVLTQRGLLFTHI